MTDPKTLARTTDPQTSKDAAEKMVSTGALSRQEKMVYENMIRFIKQYSNPMNFTTKEIAREMLPMPYYKAYDICRKRFSGLQMKNKMNPIWIGTNKKTGRNIYKRRDGCRVWRLR